MSGIVSWQHDHGGKNALLLEAFFSVQLRNKVYSIIFLLKQIKTNSV